jgi:UDP-glucose 4-epimerase
MCNLAGVPFQPEYRPARAGDIVHSLLDNRRAGERLGWSPSYDLSAGLEETLHYYRQRK